MVKAQEWLDKNYPIKERENIWNLDISNKGLEGDLDLSSFPSLFSLDITGNSHLGKVKTTKEWVIIKKRMKAQEWLEKKYPNKENVEKIIREHNNNNHEEIGRASCRERV